MRSMVVLLGYRNYFGVREEQRNVLPVVISILAVTRISLKIGDHFGVGLIQIIFESEIERFQESKIAA